MKVKKQFVIGMYAGDKYAPESNRELKDGVFQLSAAYGGEAYFCKVNAKGNVTQIKDMKLSTLNVESVKANITKETQQEKSIGVYLLSHGNSNVASGITGDLVAKVIGELGFKELSKLSLVICRTFIEDNGEYKYNADDLIQYMGRELGREYDLFPLIAAYGSFVTIAPGKIEEVNQKL
jgi:hypothetical protein